MKRTKALLLLAVSALWLLASCTPTPIVQTVVVPGPTQVVTATPRPSPTPSPTTLTICQDGEPETLYLYGGSETARNVLEAIYDGPIDHLSYGFQPVILEKLPRLEDGDAYFTPVNVQAGDRVVDITGRPVTLEEGVRVFPNHTCMDPTNPDCVVTFDGESVLEMEQMVVQWQLKEGMTWSDGEPVTAEDSVYSYQLACDPETPASDLLNLPWSKELCERTASYAAAGALTVVWTGLPGYVDDLYALNFFTPLPRHLWQGYAPDSLVIQPESARQPVGWGPFVLTEWVQGDHITLERNPRYFRADEGLPKVDRIVFRFASDVNDLVAMMMAGECDIGLMGDGRLGNLLPSDLDEVMPILVAAQKEGLLNLVTARSDVWEHLAFGILPAQGYRRPDLFADTRVRRAIAQCVDRQTLVDELTFGMGVVADAYLPPDHPLYDPDRITHWPYDPQAGRALLEEVGWTDEDGDGVVEAHGVAGVRRGTPFEVELMFPSDNPQQEIIARILRANLADCGIQVDLVPVPLQDFLADGPQGPLLGRQFDLALFNWFNEFEPPCALYLTEQIPGPEDWGRFNVTGFSDEAYDQACRAALTAMPGTEEYREHHLQALEIFSQQLPDLPLFWWIRVAVARPEVTDLTVDPSEESLLWNIESIGLGEP